MRRGVLGLLCQPLSFCTMPGGVSARVHAWRCFSHDCCIAGFSAYFASPCHYVYLRVFGLLCQPLPFLYHAQLYRGVFGLLCQPLPLCVSRGFRLTLPALAIICIAGFSAYFASPCPAAREGRLAATRGCGLGPRRGDKVASAAIAPMATMVAPPSAAMAPMASMVSPRLPWHKPWPPPP